MGTNITVDFAEGREPAAASLNEEEAVAALLAGAAGGYYSLPDALRKAAAGAAALLRASEAAEATRRERFSAGWDGEVRNQIAAKLRDAAATSGAVPKADPAAELGRLRAEEAALRDSAAILEIAARGASTYPAFHARSSAEEIAANLDTALAALLKDAGPNSEAISGVDPDGPDALVSAYRLAPAAYDELERLTGRLLALEDAGQAMRALGVAWPGSPIPDDRPPLLRLAALAQP